MAEAARGKRKMIGHLESKYYVKYDTDYILSIWTYG
jgi:hypothetical protein